MVALLDANVLLALFDPEHIYHQAAHNWFAPNRRRRWATCAFTENAFVRISSNPAYPGRRTTVADAVSRLRTFCARDEHIFWPDSVSLLSLGMFDWNRVQGHRQLTDVYLLALSVSNQGTLATFDSTISLKAVTVATPQNLELLPA